MLRTYRGGTVTWIDLESPTREEVRSIVETFGISTMVAEELLLPSTKPRAEFYNNYLYLIVHFPALRHSHRTLEQEIDFVVGKHFIITTHYDMLDPLHKFTKLFEVNSVLNADNLGEHAGYVLFYILKHLYKSVEHENDYVKRHLATIEESIFSGQEVRMVEVISQSARDLLNLRQTIEPHREVLHTLESEGAKLFGEEFVPYLRGISNEYYRVHNRVMRNTESLHELRETNNSLLTTKQNETMRVLTLMAFVTFPLSLVVSIFNLNAKYNPVRNIPYDFWFIIGAIIFCGVLMFWYFKRKKWL